jgi:hypothetical protein
VIAIQFARGAPESEIWRALYGASSLHRFAGKWIVAVDEDIAPDNADALFWAMSYRCQPQHDLHVVPHKDPGHGPRGPRDGGESAAVLINATLKGTFSPVGHPSASSWRTPARSGSGWGAAAHAAAALARLRPRLLGGPTRQARWRRGDYFELAEPQTSGEATCDERAGET